MSKPSDRFDRPRPAVGVVRQSIEHQLDLLRRRNDSSPEIVETLSQLVAQVMENVETQFPIPLPLDPPDGPPRENIPLLANLRVIPSRLSVNAVTALHHIRQSPQNPVELSQILGVSAAAMTGMLDTLVDRGLATRREDPKDRRKVIIEPTSKGIDLANQIFVEVN